MCIRDRLWTGPEIGACAAPTARCDIFFENSDFVDTYCEQVFEEGPPPCRPAQLRREDVEPQHYVLVE
eukprot:10240381-Alexandrium_andersonii.AAC.1